METDIIIGIILGGILVYIFMKLKTLENALDSLHKAVSETAEFLNDFPSPEELAKEVMKIKVPITDLPPDLQNKLKQFNQHQQMPPHTFPIPTEEQTNEGKKNLKEYTG